MYAIYYSLFTISHTITYPKPELFIAISKPWHLNSELNQSWTVQIPTSDLQVINNLQASTLPFIMADHPHRRRNARKQNLFQKDCISSVLANLTTVKLLMYAFGDDPNPNPESVNILEEIVTEYINEMVLPTQTLSLENLSILWLPSRCLLASDTLSGRLVLFMFN